MGNICCCKSIFACSEGKNTGLSDPLIHQAEREAIRNLLQFLENRHDIDFFSGEPLCALSTLAYSDSIDLQRSAAFAFAEVTKKDVRQVGYETLDPVLFLLQSHDVEVQRASSAALGSLAVNVENKLSIIRFGGLQYLIQQMNSLDLEVQCNTVGCITNLTTHDENKSPVASSEALQILIDLTRSDNQKVQRNAVGALLNMTHTQENRQLLMSANVIPALIHLLNSSDAYIQYYCTTALSNIAVDDVSRIKLAQSDPQLVQYLIQLMDAKSLKVQCQAALALRNFASDEKFQLEIVQCGGLTPILRLLKSSFLPLILSSVACVRNISIHPANESPIIDAGFINPLIELLCYNDNEEIQYHAVSTLRNLAASTERNKRAVVEAGVVERIKQSIQHVPMSVQIEMIATLAVLAVSDEIRTLLLQLGIPELLAPMALAHQSELQAIAAMAINNMNTKSAFV